jgi:hypothetical protein
MAYTTINKPSEYFNTKLYTGNSSTQSITGVGFQPDFLWLKDRSSGGTNVLVDVIRGSTKWLASDQTSGEVTRADQVTSFDTDGFSLGADSGNFINGNGNNCVAWNWLANGAGVSNTDGDITSTVSANQTAGFSISTFTVSGSGNIGVGHGLGAKPKVVITKSTSNDTNWNVYHEDTSASPENDYLYLNATDAKASSTDVWGDGMTTNTFGLGVDIGVSVGRSYVAYCFAEKKGFSKFGSYNGNGNADGTFVYTGFKPAFIMVKGYAGSDDWIMMDNKRSGYNSENEYLDANNNSAESNGSGNIDFLSNGFKIRSTFSSLNYVTGSYIYMAFAENPLVGTNGVPATAR